MGTEPVALYLHIPFCRSKCFYCDFASYAGREALVEPYVDALAREAAWLGARLENVGEARTVYFGGGTPTLLRLEHFARLLDALPLRGHEAEVTVEANPAEVTLDYLRGLRALGVNRLSLGVQGMDDALLERLGRRHRAAEAIACFEAARRAGFANISLDLIFGAPGQTLGGWRETLRGVIALAPEHLSLYALTIEERTVFGRLERRGELSVPGEDAQAEMYLLAEEELDRAGFEHYEISNWAARRGGVATRAEHNLVYWRNEPYIGLGVAAHSFFGGRRFANVRSIRAYIAAISAGRPAVESEEEIGPALEMAETMMMGLRLMEGVSFRYFAGRFGRPMEECYAEPIADLTALGLLEKTGEGIALTPRGRLLGNEVFARFLSPVGVL